MTEISSWIQYLSLSSRKYFVRIYFKSCRLGGQYLYYFFSYLHPKLIYLSTMCLFVSAFCISYTLYDTLSFWYARLSASISYTIYHILLLFKYIIYPTCLDLSQRAYYTTPDLTFTNTYFELVKNKYVLVKVMNVLVIFRR